MRLGIIPGPMTSGWATDTTEALDRAGYRSGGARRRACSTRSGRSRCEQEQPGEQQCNCEPLPHLSALLTILGNNPL